MSPQAQAAFDRIKESVGIRGDIALYEGDRDGCLPSNRWSKATPVLILSRKITRLRNWPEAHIYDFIIRQELVHIKEHHSGLDALVWAIWVAVGAFFGDRKKLAFLIVASVIGKYCCMKVRYLQKIEADIKALALCNSHQISFAQYTLLNELEDFQRWRSQSLWRRLFYRHEGAPRSLFWEVHELIATRLERVNKAFLEKLAQESS